MEITKEMLIDKLFDVQENQFQVGYNTAIIHLLKSTQIDYVPKLSLRDAFCNEMVKSGFENELKCLSVNKVDEIIQSIKNSSLLESVKKLKEYTGMGLKDSKYIIDKMFLIKDY